MRDTFPIPMLILSLACVVGCGGSRHEAKNSDNDTAGEKIDQAAADTEHSAEKATEKTGEAAEEAGDKVKEKTKDED